MTRTAIQVRATFGSQVLLETKPISYGKYDTQIHISNTYMVSIKLIIKSHLNHS